VKGAADAKVTAIYARAYNKDTDFYQFWKTMETLKSSLDEKTWLILFTDSQLLTVSTGKTAASADRSPLHGSRVTPGA
jgi:regulator of protease activity HflC (stomatin/prohibitin superfamily)